ncbi:MAG: hypothetical protein JXA16_00965 [Bacteroidales bacterium]|nr:hypothetical protein [Bacteroidales bacterium]
MLKLQLLDIPGIKLIEYFNDQYSGILHTAPVLFIEFPDALSFETLSKDMQQAAFKARIHTVTKVIQKADKSINEDSVEGHFNICDAVFEKLQGFRAIDENGQLIFNSVSMTVFEHHQEMRGFMVTTQDFEGIVYHRKSSVIAFSRPNVEIIKE